MLPRRLAVTPEAHGAEAASQLVSARRSGTRRSSTCFTVVDLKCWYGCIPVLCHRERYKTGISPQGQRQAGGS
eukprot:500147-Hanusia_phi.AAC.2